MRAALNRFGIPIAILAVLIVAWQFRSYFQRPPVNIETQFAFYLDEDSGEESIQSVRELPPMGGAKGRPSVIRVIKITCDGGATSRPLYMLKYSDEALAELQYMKRDDPHRDELMKKGEMVRIPDPWTTWVPANSDEAAVIFARPNCPDGKPARLVEPKRP
jgi:hypothetical protein